MSNGQRSDRLWRASERYENSVQCHCLHCGPWSCGSLPGTRTRFVAEVGFDVGAGASDQQVALSVRVFDPLRWDTYVGRERAASAGPERHEPAGSVDLDPVDGADVAVLRPHPGAGYDVVLGGTQALALVGGHQYRPSRC